MRFEKNVDERRKSLNCLTPQHFDFAFCASQRATTMIYVVEKARKCALNFNKCFNIST